MENYVNGWGQKQNVSSVGGRSFNSVNSFILQHSACLKQIKLCIYPVTAEIVVIDSAAGIHG